jgi:hypothetical protein
MVTINETQIKKDLFKSKAMARFSHYMAGNLYYHVDLEDGTYQFPIATVDVGNCGFDNKGDEVLEVRLSEDLGTTSFNAEIRGSELSRWISKAIKNETFIKLG